MRHEDWPEALARYVRRHDNDVDDAVWIDGWIAECGARRSGDIAHTLAQRGDIVAYADGTMGIVVGQYAATRAGALRSVLDAVRAVRVD